jgi:MerR family copper efflux transcriptional regulator
VSEEPVVLQIGEVAERVGLSLRTVRYYEEVGLVTPSARTDGGFRLYSEAAVERLLLVKRMKPLGLSLDEIRELAELIERSARPDEQTARALKQLEKKLGSYAGRTDDAIGKLERDLGEARQLRLRIGEALSRCQARLERAKPAPR